jgi:hypothetical protein
MVFRHEMFSAFNLSFTHQIVIWYQLHVRHCLRAEDISVNNMPSCPYGADSVMWSRWGSSGVCYNEMNKGAKTKSRATFNDQKEEEIPEDTGNKQLER